MSPLKLGSSNAHSVMRKEVETIQKGDEGNEEHPLSLVHNADRHTAGPHLRRFVCPLLDNGICT